MPVDDEFVKQVLDRAKRIKNPATGETLKDVLEPIILSCAKVTETPDELMDCIEDALGEVKDLVEEVLKSSGK